MSPEQISNDGVTYATDIFSLGVVAYQLLSGTNPFSGDNFQEIYKKVNYVRQPRLSELRNDLPEGVDVVVNKMLHKEVDKRYRTALDVAAVQGVVMDQVKDQMVKNLKAMDPESLMKTWAPHGLKGIEELQKAFWSQLAPRAGGKSEPD